MVGSWDDTDVLALEKASEGHSLLILGEAIIGRDSGVDATSLRNFLLRIEGDYGDNPYHGSFHGADVAADDAQLSLDAKFVEALDNRRFTGWLRRGRGA